MKQFAAAWERLFKSNCSKTRHFKEVKPSLVKLVARKLLMIDYKDNLQKPQKDNPWNVSLSVHFQPCIESDKEKKRKENKYKMFLRTYLRT